MMIDNLSLKLIDFMFLDKKVSVSSFEEFPILKKASQNRILYEFCKKVKKQNLFSNPKVDLAIEEGNCYLSKLKNTLLFVKKEFRDIPYLIVKTQRNHQYITYDVDVLVNEKDFWVIQNKFKNTRFKKHPQAKIRKQVNLVTDYLLKIDLHRGFFWQGFEYLDPETIWMDSRESIIEGIKVPIPSVKAEVLVNLAHFLSERRYLTLLEFWYFRDVFKKGFDKNYLYVQAQKYNWEKGLYIGLSALETINRNFLGEKGVFSDYSLKRRKIYTPFFLKIREVAEIFLEKTSADKRYPIFEFFYYFFSLLRYNFSNKKLFPYYREWFDFDGRK